MNTKQMNSRAARAWRDFQDQVARQGGEVLEARWLGSRAPHRVRCPQGHECSPRPNSLQNGQGLCFSCSGRSTAVAESAFRSRIEELGGAVLGVYANNDVPVLLRCPQGHECSPRPSSVMRGSGLCNVCSDRSADAAGNAFRSRIAELGGTVLGVYVNNKTPVAVRCSEGHDASPRPDHVLRGSGICRTCAGKAWDIFYVVGGPEGIKFGITSGDPKPRLADHRRDGYTEVHRLVTGLPGTTAVDLERELISLMKQLNVAPVRGREYYPASVLRVVLAVTEEWLSF